MVTFHLSVIGSLQVIRSLKRALQPAVTDVSVQFKVPKEYNVLQSPQKLPPIFNGEKLVVYGILKSKSSPKKNKVDCTAVLKGNVLGKSQKHEVPFTLELSEAPSLATAHHLAAKALITDWENKDNDKKSIVKLSVEASVVSSHTAFIAVDEESSEPIPGAMKTYDIQSHFYGNKLLKRYGAARPSMPARSRGISPPLPRCKSVLFWITVLLEC